MGKASDYKQQFKGWETEQPMTTEKMQADFADELSRLTPEQALSQLEAAESIMGPDPLFDDIRVHLEAKVKGTSDGDKPKSKLVMKPKKDAGDAEEK